MSDPLVQTPGKEPELSELLHLMHVVDVERQKRDLALLELSTEDKKKRLREELRKVYAAEGANVSQNEIDAAIDAHYADRFVFKPPARNLTYQLARLYAARSWVFTRVVVPVLALQLMVAGIAGAVFINVRARHRAEQKAAQTKVERFQQEVHRAQMNLDLSKGRLAKVAQQGGAINLTDAQAHLQRGADRLHMIDSFLASFCPGANARREVTLDNYSDVLKQMPLETSMLADAREETSAVETFCDNALELLAMGHSIDTQIAEIRASSPPERLTQQSESAYRDGKAAYEQNDRNGIRASSAELARLKSIIGQLAKYRVEASQLLHAITTVAKEKAATEQGTALASQITDAVTQGDLEVAIRDIARLRDLRTTVESEYAVRIVDRAGVKTGVTRTPRSSRSTSYCYLMVEAVTPDNRILRRSIASEETQQTESVTVWGERVPKELYDQVKAEKQRAGRVENKILLIKERGFLTEQPGRLEKKTGEIIRW